MKHLFILLFTTVCFSQNAKVTAYRMINWGSDSPCSIVNHIYLDKEIKEKTGIKFISYITAESHDQKLIKKLITIKMNAKQWEKKNHICTDISIPGDRIPHMFVIENKNSHDTIFTSHENDYIIFPEEMSAYHDKKNILFKALNGNIRQLFTHDFSPQIQSQFFQKENDSISTDKISYNGNRAIDVFNENFNKQPGRFVKFRELPGDNYILETYAFNNDTVNQYYKQIDITVTNPDSGWNIDEIKVGDSEEKFSRKYPVSAKVQKFYDIRYEDIIRRYFYSVELTNNKGNIIYFIKDKVIDKIEIHLN